MDVYKINIILRYLERLKSIIVDNDGYIVWTRDEVPDLMTLGEVANISDDLKEFLKKNSTEVDEGKEI